MIIAPLGRAPASVRQCRWSAGSPTSPVFLPLAVGLLVVGCLALGSRALHLDGLADTVDGFGAGWTRGAVADGDAARRCRADGCCGADRCARPAGGVHRRAGPAALRCSAHLRGGVLLPRGAVSDLSCAACRPPGTRALASRSPDSVPRSAAAGCWVAVLVIMAGAAALIGHNPASGALAAAAAALAVGVSGLPLGTPAGWHHRRRHGRRDRDRVHRHDHRGDHMSVTIAGLVRKRS